MMSLKTDAVDLETLDMKECDYESSQQQNFNGNTLMNIHLLLCSNNNNALMRKTTCT